jgi:hypothetical protein
MFVSLLSGFISGHALLGYYFSTAGGIFVHKEAEAGMSMAILIVTLLVFLTLMFVSKSFASSIFIFLISFVMYFVYIMGT